MNYEINYNEYPIVPVPGMHNKRSFSYPSQHGKCFWCGKELIGRQRSYCSSEHYYLYFNAFNWDTLRSKILKRDGWKCVKCKKSDSLQVDHKIALMNNGDFWDEFNLQTLCTPCHGTKTSMDYTVRKHREGLFRHKDHSKNKKIGDFF